MINEWPKWNNRRFKMENGINWVAKEGLMENK